MTLRLGYKERWPNTSRELKYLAQQLSSLCGNLVSCSTTSLLGRPVHLLILYSLGQVPSLLLLLLLLMLSRCLGNRRVIVGDLRLLSFLLCSEVASLLMSFERMCIDCCLMPLNILYIVWGVTPSPLFRGFVLKATAGSVCLSSIFKLTVLLYCT